MKKGNATIAVVLSKAQIRELLFVSGQAEHQSPDLKQARTTLKRILKDADASNDGQATSKEVSNA